MGVASVVGRGFAAGLAGAVAVAAPALAGPLTAAQILGAYNLVTAGSAGSQSDIEGAAVIGGNLSGSPSFFNNASDLPADRVVDVYGAVTAGNVNFDNGGSLSYAGTLRPGQANFNGGGAQIASGPALPLSDYTAPLGQLSTALAGLTPNSAVGVAGGAATFDAVAGAGGVAVFALTAAQLEADLTNASIGFEIGLGVTGVVVDVSGNFTEPSSTNWNGAPLRDVLFNFTDATDVTLGNWQASVLAPEATVAIANGALNGSLFAASFAGGGELHDDTFTGSLPPGGGVTGAAAPVPAPGPLSLLGVALAALWAVRRRHAGPASRGLPPARHPWCADRA